MQAWDEQHPDVELECGTRGWRRLRLACEAAKRELSVHDTTAIDLVELTGPEEARLLGTLRACVRFLGGVAPGNDLGMAPPPPTWRSPHASMGHAFSNICSFVHRIWGFERCVHDSTIIDLMELTACTGAHAFGILRSPWFCALHATQAPTSTRALPVAANETPLRRVPKTI